jgi:outer membrane protein TolC
LAQVLGVDAGTLGDPIDGAPVAAPTDTLATALQRRADLRAAEQRMLAATAGVQARKAEYRPQVYAFGMTDFGAPGGAGYTLGVGAGIPVVDGGRRKAQLAEAGQAVSQAQAARDTVMLQVKADVAGAEARVVAARQNIDTAGTQVTAAQEAFDVSSVRYGAGKGTIVELLDSQRALTDARQSLAIAQARYRSALAELYQAMGLETIPAA